jgi:hypothetical protein
MQKLRVLVEQPFIFILHQSIQVTSSTFLHLLDRFALFRRFPRSLEFESQVSDFIPVFIAQLEELGLSLLDTRRDPLELFLVRLF